jgi:hypothetical protein
MFCMTPTNIGWFITKLTLKVLGPVDLLFCFVFFVANFVSKFGPPITFLLSPGLSWILVAHFRARVLRGKTNSARLQRVLQRLTFVCYLPSPQNVLVTGNRQGYDREMDEGNIVGRLSVRGNRTFPI